MNLKANTLVFLAIFSAISMYGSHDEALKAKDKTIDYSQMLKDLELAVKLGSGEPVAIDINSTKGLEGQIAGSVREALNKDLPE